MSHEGGWEDMAKLPYEKPELRHLGLLRELTKMSGWNDRSWNDGGWGGSGGGGDWVGGQSSYPWRGW